jgi:hypothetical protein
MSYPIRQNDYSNSLPGIWIQAKSRSNPRDEWSDVAPRSFASIDDADDYYSERYGHNTDYDLRIVDRYSNGEEVVRTF